MRKIAQTAILAAVCTLTAVSVAGAQSSIDVVGLDGHKAAVSFHGLERRSVTTADRAGIKTIHEGVLLRDVLDKAKVPSRPPLTATRWRMRSPRSMPPSTITWC